MGMWMNERANQWANKRTSASASTRASARASASASTSTIASSSANTSGSASEKVSFLFDSHVNVFPGHLVGCFFPSPLFVVISFFFLISQTARGALAPSPAPSYLSLWRQSHQEKRNKISLEPKIDLEPRMLNIRWCYLFISAGVKNCLECGHCFAGHFAWV